MTYIPTGRKLIDPFEFLNEVGIRTGMKVADFGCGTLGHFVFPAAELVGPEGKVYAVDVLKSVLDGVGSRAKMKGGDNVETVWGDIERVNGVKIPDNSLDMVILANNLFMSKQKPTMMAEIFRVLRPGGKLAIAEWKPTGIAIGPKGDSAVTPETAQSLAEGVGFVLEKKFEPGKYHYGLFLSKP